MRSASSTATSARSCRCGELVRRSSRRPPRRVARADRSRRCGAAVRGAPRRRGPRRAHRRASSARRAARRPTGGPAAGRTCAGRCASAGNPPASGAPRCRPRRRARASRTSGSCAKIRPMSRRNAAVTTSPDVGCVGQAVVGHEVGRRRGGRAERPDVLGRERALDRPRRGRIAPPSRSSSSAVAGLALDLDLAELRAAPSCRRARPRRRRRSRQAPCPSVAHLVGAAHACAPRRPGPAARRGSRR